MQTFTSLLVINENILLHFFIALHRCCIVYKLKARPSDQQKDYNLLYCSGLEMNLQHLQGLPV